MFRSSKVLPLTAMTLFYKALAHSYIVYYLEMWGNAPQTHLEKDHNHSKKIDTGCF